jgi:alpha-1,6-mannosyltransferase
MGTNQPSRMIKRALFGLGVLSLVPYLVAWQLGDLRQHTPGFEIAFFAAFALYAGATVLALRLEALSRRELVLVYALALLFQACLVFTRPTLSDDMYRYVWDGRVQAQGISPYRYAPEAPQLAHLRDDTIWRFVNRKGAVTVYPPLAEMAFGLVWRIRPDDVRWVQIVMGVGGLAAGGLLMGLLKAMGRSPGRVLIYLWSPLLAFETAHSAHVDGLVLPLLVAAWWARVKERDSLVGILLGLGTAVKLYPALLAPALWRPHHPSGRWRMPLAFIATTLACYVPYQVFNGGNVNAFLPNYLREHFNLGPLVNFLFALFRGFDLGPMLGVRVTLLAILALASLVMVLRPATDGETAVRRCIWLIGAYTLLYYNLFSWYLLWLLPLLALFVQPGRFFGLQADAWTGWWLFSGLIALSYTFFIAWKPVPLLQWVEFVPLYLFLLLDLLRRGKNFTLDLRYRRQSVTTN